MAFSDIESVALPGPLKRAVRWVILAAIAAFVIITASKAVYGIKMRVKGVR